MNALFAGLYAPGARWMVGRHARVWRPPTDVYETDQNIIVHMEIAGMRRDDFYITLEDRRLVISGVRSRSASQPGAYHQMEVNFGEFRSEVELFSPVDTERIEADYEDGFLRVTLPKASPRRVEIR
jgi:HSP20 family protein